MTESLTLLSRPVPLSFTSRFVQCSRYGTSPALSPTTKLCCLVNRVCSTDPNMPSVQFTGRLLNSLRALPHRFGRPLPDEREHLVILGGGWSALYLMRQIDFTRYKVTVISPRPHFVFTPLLTSVVGGVLSARAVMEPLRNKMRLGGSKSMDFIQALVDTVDIDKKSVEYTVVGDVKSVIHYDKLVIAVGSETNTFGVPGVREHCSFLKEIEDAKEIRRRLLMAFEKASQTAAKDREDLLSFVVVGGGPAGVEVAAEINDMIQNDLKRHFPSLVPQASVKLLEMTPRLLPMYHPEVSEFTRKRLLSDRVDVRLKHRVRRVDSKFVHIVDEDNKETQLPHSLCIWASGVGTVPLVKKLVNTIPAQEGNNFLGVKPFLELLGVPSVYAIGDCAQLIPPPSVDKADELWEAAMSTKDWTARFVNEGYVQLHSTQSNPEEGLRSREQFSSFLKECDQQYRSPARTAQMARQAGSYLGVVLNRMALKGGGVKMRPFLPRTYGAMAYVGNHEAIVELVKRWDQRDPDVKRLMGKMANWLWRTYYWWSQTSFYNQVLSSVDYTKTALVGRDLSELAQESTASRLKAD
eukprot:Blabericola_migrator_1__559@NODE_1138_length_5313_cov_213_148685_g774_i0_p2_GENE_NODE_1138_length_5313_cov_213_148685_g774_i0NODE_1138_length_5313_cov_213_148685_g774_i0_p2_ORF_typecomplete_len580_score82_19Pyr_redox_2/PF07992_14/4_3e47Pyr_redox/PF00070_27/1_5Pyr_redox/PF00070_27/2_2e09K_oxygenase/PF13434_6/4_9K_oxygenase/PF13434_6/0_096K_oxygenase/PF13434_6/2_7e03Pyr_redox_3/PF13738_6/27Pyr_redox_3/PF13738_6/0_19Pyr_redox_3/PF13738_6/5_3Pyr_redox_3/PF13738_6/1_2e03Lycopene_cycl/PF05834_12/0_9Ly